MFIFQKKLNGCVDLSAIDALEVLPPVEASSFDGENWAEPLTHLWQSSPPNLKKEKEYNQRMGSKRPYCSICMLFQTYQQVLLITDEWLSHGAFILSSH